MIFCVDPKSVLNALAYTAPGTKGHIEYHNTQDFNPIHTSPLYYIYLKIVSIMKEVKVKIKSVNGV
jgi:hypothetical protein